MSDDLKPPTVSPFPVPNVDAGKFGGGTQPKPVPVVVKGKVYYV